MAVLIAALILAALALAVLYAVWALAFRSTARQRRKYSAMPEGEQYYVNRDFMLSLIDEMRGLEYEDVEIKSFDGLTLHGRWYQLREGAPVQIEMHGYRGEAVRDFCGGNKLSRSMGMNTLVVDQRAHGESGGSCISFGVKERFDCQSWAQYVYLRCGPETPIYLAGVSMGAATVLMAADLQLPHTVRGIIADCPYTSPEAIIRKVISQDLHLPAGPLMPLVRLSARLFGGFSLSGASAEKSVAETDIPILLIHGEDDRFVPCDMSRELAAKCASPHELVTFPGAGHGLSYIVDPARYERAVRQFVGERGE